MQIGLSWVFRFKCLYLIQGRLSGLEGDDSEAARSEMLDLRARLTTHRREIRLAEAELERLGCIVDSDHPWRVKIPGIDGRLEAGFQLDLLKSELGSSSTGTAAA